MAKKTVEIIGAERILYKINGIRPSLEKAIHAVALEVKGYMAHYPKRREGVKMPMSRGMLIGFLARLNQGLIEFPYVRGSSPGSEDLANKWAVKIDKKELEGRVGNTATYGPFVQDEDEQLFMHADSGWPTIQGAKAHFEPVLTKMLKDAVEEVLNARLVKPTK